MHQMAQMKRQGFYSPGMMGPRLGNGGVAGAYSGWPDHQLIAEGCGYPDVYEPGPDYAMLLTWVALIALGVLIGTTLSSGRDD